MDRPYIKINDELIFLPTVKVRTWRKLMKLEDECTKYKTIQDIIAHSEVVEKYCEVIACAFGVTADEVLDNLDANEVLPTYFSVLNYVITMLTEKLVTDKKNEVETAGN